MAATGGWPRQVEVDTFMERLKKRSTFKFLRELFDAEVLTADGKRVATLAEMERNAIVMAVEASGRSRKAAARLLGIHPTTLWRKMKDLGIEKNS